MTTAAAELARVVAHLAELVASSTGEPDAHEVARRARQLAGRLRGDDPARWAMREQSVTVEVDVPARIVAETLANEETGAVLVVASGGPIGVVAERDVVKLVAEGADLDQLTAADVIAEDLVSAEPGDSIDRVAALMVDHRVRHVPLVVGGRLVGVVSALDLLRATLGAEPLSE